MPGPLGGGFFLTHTVCVCPTGITLLCQDPSVGGFLAADLSCAKKTVHSYIRGVSEMAGFIVQFTDPLAYMPNRNIGYSHRSRRFWHFCTF